MKQLLLGFLTIVFLSGNISETNAQDLNKGKELLAKVSKNYRGMKAMKADFKYTVEMPRDKFKEESKGIIYLKGSKFRLEMAEQNVICDGTTLWTHLPEDNSVQITHYDPTALGVNPSEIFTMYEKGYISAYMGVENGYHLVELTPSDKKKSVFKIKLFIDKAKNLVSKSKTYEKNGNIYTYEIISFNPNPSNAVDNFFSFDKSKYPKIIVTDLTK